MSQMNMIQALNSAMDVMMARDPGVVLWMSALPFSVPNSPTKIGPVLLLWMKPQF